MQEIMESQCIFSVQNSKPKHIAEKSGSFMWQSTPTDYYHHFLLY